MMSDIRSKKVEKEYYVQVDGIIDQKPSIKWRAVSK
jgi:16S rRNA U516 pseudouridylate synthase RsuA-like enzyme